MNKYYLRDRSVLSMQKNWDCLYFLQGLDSCRGLIYQAHNFDFSFGIDLLKK